MEKEAYKNEYKWKQEKEVEVLKKEEVKEVLRRGESVKMLNI
jgi:hypothetical protein